MSSSSARNSRSSPLRPAFLSGPSSNSPFYGNSQPFPLGASGPRIGSPNSIATRPSSSRGASGIIQTPITPQLPSSVASTNSIRHQSAASIDVALNSHVNEWSYIGVDVSIKDLDTLRVNLEQSSAKEIGEEQAALNKSADLGSNEFMSCSFASDRWKVEIVRRPEEQGTHLSLYLCCSALETDYPSGDTVIPTTIMACVREPNGKRQVLWQIWEEHHFAQEKEYWECHTFPLPSFFLANPKVAASDALIFSIQLQSPLTGPIPEVQHARQVPCNMLSGLSRLLDDKRTGDVQFVVYERKSPETPLEAEPNTLRLGVMLQPLYRKRTIYAHSAVLRARAIYFESMLGSDWQETEGNLNTIKIPDFDYISVYWLIRWIYTNEITFADNEEVNPSLAEDFAGGVLVGRAGPGYDWQRLTFGSESGSSNSTTTFPGRGERSDLNIPPRSATSLGQVRTRTTRVPTSVASNLPTTKTAEKRRATTPEAPGRVSPVQSLTSLRQLGSPKQHSRNEDPHQHPVTLFEPASALQIYKIAHRYGLQELAALALNHVASSLTPQTAFPLLLATQLYPALYASIKTYALDNYYAVSSCSDFKRCFQEVGMGTWGEQGGEVLFDFMTSLAPL